MQYKVTCAKELGTYTIRINGHFVCDFQPITFFYSAEKAERDAYATAIRLMNIFQGPR